MRPLKSTYYTNKESRLLFNKRLSEKNLGSDLLSHKLPCSIIGDGRLNFRVRNGIGCTPTSMATKKKLYLLLKTERRESHRFHQHKIKSSSDLLSHRLPCSIIGDGWLNFRVRNGIGCTPTSMVTRKKLGSVRYPERLTIYTLLLTSNG